MLSILLNSDTVKVIAEKLKSDNDRRLTAHLNSITIEMMNWELQWVWKTAAKWNAMQNERPTERHTERNTPSACNRKSILQLVTGNDTLVKAIIYI